MNDQFYRKLVDLYAGRDLPAELEQELEQRASEDPELALEMSALRGTVDTLQAIANPEFTEESYQRILMKLYARGADIQPKSPDPSHLQYYLPMQG